MAKTDLSGHRPLVACAHRLAEVGAAVRIADVDGERAEEVGGEAYVAAKHVVAFLCSPAASFITGSAVTVDGGWSAR